MFALLLAKPAMASEPCHQSAIGDLKRLSPEGFAIYARASSKKDFLQWVTCDDVQLGLTTAVHETVHIQTEEVNAYPLISGEKLTRVPEGAFAAPRIVAGKFSAESTYVTTYLKPGAASSADEFRYLLDEFNAYAHDLNSAVKLQRIASPNREVYHRDGLAALMSFVAVYIEEVRARHPQTWKNLQHPVVKTTVVKLWQQAERVMASSCASPRIGYEAPKYLSKVCATTARHGLGQMLGRAPLCPKACTSEPQTAAVEFEINEAGTTAPQ